jgi:Domain of unknown function (DUF4288)
VNQVWFSAMLRFVILIQDEGASRLSRSVIVFRAEDWPDAKKRALELGYKMERSYQGGTGLEVRWRLAAVETLDLLGDTVTDGREVYSEPAELRLEHSIDFDTKLDPENSEPGQSGV